MDSRKGNVKGFSAACFFLFLAVIVLPGFAAAQEPEINFIPGPTRAVLGKNIAEVEIGENYVFAGPEDTRKLMALMGNPPSDSEVGLIAPKSDESSWFVVVSYLPVGYIKDDEKDSIDADAIFQNISEGTEEANKIRAKNGESLLHVKRWYEEPHYDESSNHLVWALLAEDDLGNEVINYNTRMLGRSGYMSVVLVAVPEEFEMYRSEVEELVGNVAYVQGKKYSEFVKGDAVAKYGLTALVAGGAGAVAAKAGFFKFIGKFAKIIIVGVVGFFVAFKKKLKGLFGRDA